MDGDDAADTAFSPSLVKSNSRGLVRRNTRGLSRARGDRFINEMPVLAPTRQGCGPIVRARGAIMPPAQLTANGDRGCAMTDADPRFHGRTTYGCAGRSGDEHRACPGSPAIRNACRGSGCGPRMASPPRQRPPMLLESAVSTLLIVTTCKSCSVHRYSFAGQKTCGLVLHSRICRLLSPPRIVS